jgi:hypothetical protein
MNSAVHEKLVYIKEIDAVLGSCLEGAKDYSDCRGMMEAFRDNISRLDGAPISVARYLTSVRRLANAEFVMICWKIMEPLNNPGLKAGTYEPGGLNRFVSDPGRRTGDQIRTLPRLAYLFTTAIEAYPNLLKTKFSDDFDGVPQERISHQAKKHEQELRQVCNEIENLGKSTTYWKLSITRHEGFAHSLEISRRRLRYPNSIGPAKLKFSELFEFGDAAMDLCFRFESHWRSVARPMVHQLVGTRRLLDQHFWELLHSGISIHQQGK